MKIVNVGDRQERIRDTVDLIGANTPESWKLAAEFRECWSISDSEIFAEGVPPLPPFAGAKPEVKDGKVVAWSAPL